MTKPNFETRGGLPIELRAKKGETRVSGHAAVFDEWADIGGWFEERVVPGAFDNVLEDDCVFLIEHKGLPLARTRSGTLSLSVDARGLFAETSLIDADPDVARILPKMSRGDLDKMSYSFRVGREEWDETGEIPKRTILEVSSLIDVSIVTYPAFEGTDIGLRSLADHRAGLIAPMNARQATALDLRLRALALT